MSDRSTKMSAALKAALFRDPTLVDRSNPIAEASQVLSEAILETLDRGDRDGLEPALRAALTATATDLERVSLAVTGLGWLGAGLPSVERVLVNLIGQARREVLITAFSLTNGADKVLNMIRQALETGVRCSLLINRFTEQPYEARNRLLRLQADYPRTLILFDFSDPNENTILHAKAVVADRNAALVGSANLSFNGMVMSHELAVVLKGPSAGKIAQAIDRLLLSQHITRIKF